MNAATLLAVTPMERFLGIRDRFVEGGDYGSFLLAIVVLAGLLLLLPYLIERTVRRRQRRALNNPKRLFQEVLRQVPLTVPQRELLRRIARDLRLAQPTVLLLSPRIYHENANAWMSATRNANPPTRERLDALAGALFAGEQ